MITKNKKVIILIKHMYSHLLGRTTSHSLKCPKDMRLLEFQTVPTLRHGVRKQINVGDYDYVDYYVIENPHVLSLYKDRVTLAQLFMRYRKWEWTDEQFWRVYGKRGQGKGYDLPPLSEVLKCPDYIPNVIKGDLNRKTVVNLLEEIDRVRDQTRVTRTDLERDRKAQTHGWDTEMQLYPEEMDALFSALPGASGADEEDWPTIFKEELTEDFLSEFIHFYLRNEFVDPTIARLDHVQWQQLNTKETIFWKRGQKKRSRKRNRKEMKEQFRGCNVRANYLVYRNTTKNDTQLYRVS